MSRKKHMVLEMKKSLEGKLAELENNESELIEHVKIISKGVKNLLKQSDKEKFLRAFDKVSFGLDRSLTALMLLKARLPSLESEESGSDSTPEATIDNSLAVDVPIREKTDESQTETEQCTSPAGGSNIGHSPSISRSLMKTEVEPQEDDIKRKMTVDETEPTVTADMKPLPCSGEQAQSLNEKTKVNAVASTPVAIVGNVRTRCEDHAPIRGPVSGQINPPLPSASERPVQHTPSHPPREIPPLILPERERIKVVVSEVVSPSIFWMQPVDSDIENLMEEIRSYYTKAVNLPHLNLKVGMYCCACFTVDDCWYRARVIAIHLAPSAAMEGTGVDAMVDIIYMDYGNRERIPASRLRPLHPRFMSVRVQAVCCKLAKVRPTGRSGPQWSKEDTDFFSQLTINQQLAVGQPLTAIVVRQAGDGNSSLPAVDLMFDHYINGKEVKSVDIAKLMVAQHHALPLDQRSCDAMMTRDTNLTHTPQTTDSEKKTSAAPLSGSACHEEPPKSKEKDGEEQARKKEVESSGGKKKRVKRKTKKARRSHNPDLSTEDTDVCPDVVVREGDGGNPCREEGLKESTSDAALCESESTQENNVHLHGMTPKTRCTETEIKQDRWIQAGRDRAPLVAMAARGKVPYDVVKNGKTDRVSCGSESSRSCSPNSTSGVSSAMSSAFVLPNTLKSATTQEGLSPTRSSDVVCPSEPPEEKSHAAGPPPRDSHKESSGCTPPAHDEDHSTDQTEHFFTCAEDGSEPDSEVSLSAQTTKQNPPMTPLSKKPVVQEMGRRYVNQMHFREGDEIQFAMSHIVSPEEFYIHLINSDAKKMDYLMEELNGQYSGIESSGAQECPLKWPDVGDICCAKFHQDDRWYRGVVGDVHDEKGIFVKYIDFGNEDWIPKDLVFPLERYFSTLPPLAFRCALARLKPPEITDNEDACCRVWPQESTRCLTEMGEFEKLLVGRVVRMSGDTEPKTTELIVMDNSSGEELCLNEALVDRGLASSSFYKKLILPETVPNSTTVKDEDLSEGCAVHDAKDDTQGLQIPPSEMTENSVKLEENHESLDEWNPMVQHHSSEVNSYGVDMDDPGVATTGLKSTADERVCRFYAAGKRCYKGVTCPLAHITPSREPMECAYALWCNTTVSLPWVGDWVAMEITAIHSPTHFWVQLPYGPNPLDQIQKEWSLLDQHQESRDNGETLSALTKSINDIYSKPYTRQEDLSLLALGEIVCAHFTEDSRWYRARVIDVDAEANKVEVFYVDFGNSEWLARAKVRPAMPQFLHLPFQAVECFLAGVQLLAPKPEGRIDEARKLFEKLTTDMILVAHIISSEVDSLSVELYDTTGPQQVSVGEALAKAGYVSHTHRGNES